MAKGLIFLADGMADLPLEELDGRTPLEAADTPAMDSIAANGSSGTFLTLPEGLPTSSDVANMSVLGFRPEDNYPGRGPIEAVSQDIPLAPDDIAWRCNLVTVSPDGVMEDFSAGHIDNETARRLMEDLQKELSSDRVDFHSGVSYRNLLVLHGSEFSDKINYHKPDASHGAHVSELGLSPADNSPAAAHTIRFLNELAAKAKRLLANHPLNQSKDAPATDIWLWSPGRKPSLRPFSELYPGKKGAIISAVDVIKGLGKCVGMTVLNVPGATGFIDTNYQGKAAAAISALAEHDFVYLHVEAIDESSHIGDLGLKMRTINDFDSKIVAPTLDALRDEDVVFAVLPDHPAPIKLRTHTTTPVPVAVCGPGIRVDRIKVFSESQATTGALGFMRHEELMRLILGIKN